MLHVNRDNQVDPAIFARPMVFWALYVLRIKNWFAEIKHGNPFTFIYQSLPSIVDIRGAIVWAEVIATLFECKGVSFAFSKCKIMCAL